MPKTAEIEVWVIVDADGDYRVGACEDDAVETYDHDIGLASIATRRVKVVLTVPLPYAPTLTGVVPAEGEAALTVA